MQNINILAYINFSLLFDAANITKILDIVKHKRYTHLVHIAFFCQHLKFCQTSNIDGNFNLVKITIIIVVVDKLFEYTFRIILIYYTFSAYVVYINVYTILT